MRNGPADAGRPVPLSGVADWLRLVDAAVGVGAGLERAVLHAGEGGVELAVWTSGPNRLAASWNGDAPMPSFCGVEQDVARGQAVAPRSPVMACLTADSTVLLGAGDQARVGRSAG